FTSEVFYEGRLHSHAGREVLSLAGVPPLVGTGIGFMPVTHEGHSNSSLEEARVVGEDIRQLFAAKATWTDATGFTKVLTENDVLLITPYNAQVAALNIELPGLRIGTVDKFQGQEAPV